MMPFDWLALEVVNLATSPFTSLRMMSVLAWHEGAAKLDAGK